MEFHGITFVVNMSAAESLLSVDIEQVDSGERWSGEFTSQYIEDISHKAGNFKKFSVFVKMLSSAFSRESESVYVDLLTYNDLEVLKARRLGTAAPLNSSLSSSASRSQMKRYIILTYSGEFDRVHFPLPLAHEETPNVHALQRTIKRLRQKLHEKEIADAAPVSLKEREMRQIDTQLRQENTELKHRLRQLEKRNGVSNGSSEPSGTVGKLRKQIDTLKRELADSAAAYERLRVEMAREAARWRAQTPSSQSEREKEWRAKAVGLQHALDSERIEHRREVLRLQRELEDARQLIARKKLTGASSGAGRSSKQQMSSRQIAAANRMSAGVPSTGRSRSPVPRSTRGSYSSTGGYSSGYGYSAGGTRTGAGRGRSQTSRTPPPRRSTLQSRSRSRSPSSSLGGRFDPTAYAMQRQQRISQSKSSRSAWGAGGDRYVESGYSSANSQSSNGSRRSARSTTSRASSRASSRGSAYSGEYSDSSSRRNTSWKTEDKRRTKTKPKSKRKKKQKDKDVPKRGIVSEQSISHRPAPAVDMWRDDNRFVGDLLEGYLHGDNDTSERHTLRQSLERYENSQDGRHDDRYDPRSLTASAVPPRAPESLARSHGRLPLDDIETNPSDDSEQDDGGILEKHKNVSHDVPSKGGSQNYGPQDSDNRKSYESLSSSEPMGKPQEADTTGTPKHTSPYSSAEKENVYSTRSSHNEFVKEKIRQSREELGDLLVYKDQNARSSGISRQSRDSCAEEGNENENEEEERQEAADISDIDKRINALQKFLDKARTGILVNVDSNNASDS
eukprot:CAMPEP_0185031382 /NCGR_PEP_ID=MMETSP1103-20130426/18830_1 /TAXON_ID=36769 /ORGANISM="Paraphysomonas bandaiensis, Strain Caron Lab Isolate" /LENGTH=789 /DNA_ID=CAMNT_0027566895 /DNA_START=93 /DNA_END=2462 /DNA_ORIENTATION=-